MKKLTQILTAMLFALLISAPAMAEEPIDWMNMTVGGEQQLTCDEHESRGSPSGYQPGYEWCNKEYAEQQKAPDRNHKNTPDSKGHGRILPDPGAWPPPK
ncbi:MAG: hypothetical protein WC878_08165 [Candidatus Paceibacterota bacterium]|jgi:hypothetical protein